MQVFLQTMSIPRNILFIFAGDLLVIYAGGVSRAIFGFMLRTCQPAVINL